MLNRPVRLGSSGPRGAADPPDDAETSGGPPGRRPAARPAPASRSAAPPAPPPSPAAADRSAAGARRDLVGELLDPRRELLDHLLELTHLVLELDLARGLAARAATARAAASAAAAAASAPARDVHQSTSTAGPRRGPGASSWQVQRLTPLVMDVATTENRGAGPAGPGRPRRTTGPVGLDGEPSTCSWIEHEMCGEDGMHEMTRSAADSINPANAVNWKLVLAESSLRPESEPGPPLPRSGLEPS